MDPDEVISIQRDCEAILIPAGTRLVIPAGTEVRVMQELGGSYTVAWDAGLARIEGKDADALGFEARPQARVAPAGGAAAGPEGIEREIWNQMRTCYDPEIPVNIVDLGLIYDCRVTPRTEGGFQADIKMTLTAPGCGMGEILRQDVQNRVLSIEGIDEVNVDLVWDPPWNQGMMTDAARLQLGLM